MHWRRKWQPTPVFAWRIPGTGEPGGLPSMGSQSQTRLKRLSSSSSRNTKGFPGGTSGKEPTCQCKRHKGHRFDPWDGKISRRRAWQPTPVFLPGESPWQATSHGVARSQTQLKQLSTQHTQKYKTLCLRRELSELCEYLSHSPSPQTASALWRRPLFAESFCWFP